MDWPQYTIIALLAAWAVADVAKLNGWEPSPPSAAILGFRVLFRPLFWGGVLYAGGFFSATP